MSLLNIDYSKLTLGEIADVEEHAGKVFQDIAEELQTGKPSAKTLIALVFVVKRRDNPEYTIEDARREDIAVLRPDAADETPAPKEDAPAAPGA